MAAAEEATPLGDDVEDQFFCTPETPKEDDELQAFFSCMSISGAPYELMAD